MKKLLFIILVPLFIAATINGEEGRKGKKDKEKEIYVFTNDIELKATPLKDQAKTGTCWCFATTSFLESELIRLGYGETDLSEMYFVRGAYTQKAVNYFRQHGETVFGQGGQAHDVIKQLSVSGFMPESSYSGMNIDEDKHNHSEMKSVLDATLKAVIKGDRVTPRWQDAYNALLDVYLGQVPTHFIHDNKEYSPQQFLKEFARLNPDDYIELTSYLHHPFYTKFRLEIPDNWSGDEYYNLPLDELEAVIDSSLARGITVAWDGDISDHDFSQKKGYAVVPAKSWDEKSVDEREEKITEPEAEKVVTQQLRQKYFDNFTATDDHVMHITGLAHDQKGTRYYLTKNSWGVTGKYDGYIYMSRPYVRLNTLSVLVHKDALPRSIAEKLGVKSAAVN